MKFLRCNFIMFLSLIVFITSSGFTLNLNYCTNGLQKLNIRQEVSGCLNQNSEHKFCDRIASSSKIKQINICCKNQKIQAKSQIKIPAKTKQDSFFTKSITFINSYFGSIFAFNNSDKDEEKEKESALFPLLKKGLYILLQQFRN